MRALKLAVISFCSICIFLCGCANLSGIKTLMSLGASDKLKEQASARETANFQKVKAYIEEAKINTGITKDEARRMFGEPVIIVSEDDRTKWVYKQAESDWFGGEKIYLFFDKEERLISWDHVNRK